MNRLPADLYLGSGRGEAVSALPAEIDESSDTAPDHAVPCAARIDVPPRDDGARVRLLLQAGDAALVPQPSYPIHIWGPYLAGADVRQVSMGPDLATAGAAYVDNVMAQWEHGWPRPRVVVLSFPHNPTGATVELADLQRLVDWARDKDVVLVHDFAYADVAFDGWRPPSIS